MSATDNLLSRLDGVTGNGPQYRARCPAHDSRGGTLSIREGDDGAVLIHCFAGCSPQEIVESVGLTLGDLFPKDLRTRAKGTRPRVDYRAVLEAIVLDAHVLALAIRQMATDGTLPDPDISRVEQAYLRIMRTLRHNGIGSTA